MTRQKTEHRTSSRTHEPRGSTRQFAQRRRRTNVHRTRRRLDASSLQLRGSATSYLPRARKGTTAATLASKLGRALPPELPGPGRPCRPLGLGIRGSTGPVGAQPRLPDDSTPTSVRRRYRAGGDSCSGGVPGSEECATSPRPISCVGCGGGYRGPLAFVALAECRISATTTRERRLIQRHRRVHGFCTEGSLLLSVGDRGGGNGLRPSLVRGAGVTGRPFNGSVLGSRELYAPC